MAISLQVQQRGTLTLPAELRKKHGITFGIAICADLGNREVFAECARQGARIVFELAAPGLYGEQATRDWRSGFEWWQGECQTHLSQHARDFGLWIAVATQAGRTVDEDFPGGGYLFAPDGRCLHATPDWSPGALYLELDLESCCSNSYGSAAQLTNSIVPVSRS